MPGFFIQVSTDRVRELGMCQPVSRPGRLRGKAAADLVLPLGAGLENLFAGVNAVVDALVVAGLEVQGIVMAITSPIAPVQDFLTFEENGGGHRALVLLGENHQDIVSQFATDRPEKGLSKVGQ